MVPAPPPRAGRWHSRKQLWQRLTQRDVLVVEADPATPETWRVVDPAAEAHVVLATLGNAELHDLEVAGVVLVYQR